MATVAEAASAAAWGGPRPEDETRDAACGFEASAGGGLDSAARTALQLLLGRRSPGSIASTTWYSGPGPVGEIAEMTEDVCTDVERASRKGGGS